MKKNEILDFILKYNYVFILIIIFIIPAIIDIVLYYTTPFEKTITIKDKYTRYRKGSNYNVADENNTIYQVDNIWFKLDFNRAEDYNKLEKNKTYKVRGYGIRFPMLDIYKKIYYVF